MTTHKGVFTLPTGHPSKRSAFDASVETLIIPSSSSQKPVATAGKGSEAVPPVQPELESASGPHKLAEVNDGQGPAPEEIVDLSEDDMDAEIIKADLPLQDEKTTESTSKGKTTTKE